MIAERLTKFIYSLILVPIVIPIVILICAFIVAILFFLPLIALISPDAIKFNKINKFKKNAIKTEEL